MAKGFNLTAEINLRGPSNIRQVVGGIRKQLQGVNTSLNININKKNIQGISQANSRLAAVNKTLQITTKNASSATAAFNKLSTSMRNVANVKIPNNISSGMNTATKSIQTSTKAVRQAKNEFEEFGKLGGLAIKRFAAFSVVTGAIYSVNNAIASGVKEFLEYDRQLTRVSQVLNTNRESLKGLDKTITQLSTSLGVSSSELANVTVTLSQAGIQAADTRKALDALAKSALAPTFTSLTNTTEGAIAAMRQFSITAGQLEGALGSINAVAGSFAVEAGDIITAIQRTGGVFASASKGVSQGTDALNEFIAVFTSVRATSRESAETIATGLRTIFTRIQRKDTIESLKAFGITLTDLEGKFVGPYKAIQLLSDGLKNLDTRDLRFAGIAEQLGGFRQIGKVIPLIQQFGTAQNALNVAQQGSGSLARDAAKGQLALSVQIQKVREEFTSLVRSISDSTGFRNLLSLGLDLATVFVRVADSLKGLLPLVAGLGAIKGLGALAGFTKGFGGAFKKADGGYIHKFAKGGVVPGTGSGDTVPAMLQPGEFVVRKKAVESIGSQRLHKMNKFAKGGRVGRVKNLGAHDGDSWNVIYEPADDPVGSITTRAVGYDAYELSGGKKWENKLGAIATKMAGSAYKKNQRLVGSGSFLQTFQGDKVRGKQSVGSRPKHEVSKTLVDSMVEAGVANRVTKGNNATGSTDKPSVKQIATLKANGFNYNPKTGRTTKINKKNSKALGGYIQAFASGGSVGDTVPAMLTPGEFVINKKSASQIGSRALHSLNRADKIKGYNSGGFVGFKNGGGVPARPGTTMGTIGISQADVGMLDEIGNAIKELGISSSSSADLIAQGSQVSYEAAMGALEADKMRADAIGANTDAIDASIKSLQNQGKKILKVSQALEGSSGGDLEKLSGRLNRGQDAGKASKSLRTKEGGALNNLIRSGEADAASVKEYIAGARRDRKTLNEMDSRYVNQRKRHLSALGSSDVEASKLAEQEVILRRKAVDDNAKSIGAKGPGDFGRRLGDLANKSGFAIAALGTFGTSLTEATSAAQAATQAAIAGGATAFGAGQIATGAVVDLLPTDKLKNLGGIAGTAASAVLGLGQALIDAKNAARQFNIDEAFKNSEQAMEGVNEAFGRLEKDVNNISIKASIEAKLQEAGDSLAKGLKIQNDTAKVFWSNAIDVLSAGGSEESVQRSQILEAQGFFAYLKSGFDDQFRVNSARNLAVDSSAQSAKQFQSIAQGINKVIESQVGDGLSAQDIIDGASFDSFSRSLVMADGALNKHIASIMANTNVELAERQARVDNIIQIKAEEKIRAQVAIAQRQKEIEALQQSTDIYIRSLERMYTNMEHSIGAANAALDGMNRQIDLTTASLQGQARIGDVILDSIAVLQNPRAFSGEENRNARNSAANIFGSSGNEVAGLMGVGEKLEAGVLSSLNQQLTKGETDAGVIARALSQSVSDTLSGIGLPEDLTDKLSKETNEAITAAIDKSGGKGVTGINFNQLSEELGGLNSVIQASKKAREVAIKALEFYNKALNNYTKNINKIIDIEISSRNYARKAVDLLADSEISLAKALGKTINVIDIINNREGQVRRQTGGPTSPTDIFNNITKLEGQRRNQQATVDSTSQIAGRETDQFIKFNNELKNTSISLRENISALKDMANNTDVASSALNKIQEAQQTNAQKIGFFEKVVTSTPEELENMQRSFVRLQNNINGNVNTINNSMGAQKAYHEALRSGASGFDAMRAAQAAFAKERGDTLGLMKDILPFLGDSEQTGGIRANVLESMLRESGIGVNPMMQQVLNSLKNPATDPAVAASIQQYKQANTLQVEANRLLGRLESDLASDLAAKNEQGLKNALSSVTMNFESSQLDDINTGVNMIIQIMQAEEANKGAGTFAKGGVVYASGGQEIFKPKGGDTVPAMLTPGEFVVNKKATQANLPLLKNINTGYYAGGGIVSNFNNGKDIMPTVRRGKASEQLLSKADIVGITKNIVENGGGMYSLGHKYTTESHGGQTIQTNDPSINNGAYPAFEDGPAGYYKKVVYDGSTLDLNSGARHIGVGPEYNLSGPVARNVNLSTLAISPPSRELSKKAGQLEDQWRQPYLDSLIYSGTELGTLTDLSLSPDIVAAYREKVLALKDAYEGSQRQGGFAHLNESDFYTGNLQTLPGAQGNTNFYSSNRESTGILGLHPEKPVTAYDDTRVWQGHKLWGSDATKNQFDPLRPLALTEFNVDTLSSAKPNFPNTTLGGDQYKALPDTANNAILNTSNSIMGGQLTDLIGKHNAVQKALFEGGKGLLQYPWDGPADPHTGLPPGLGADVGTDVNSMYQKLIDLYTGAVSLTSLDSSEAPKLDTPFSLKSLLIAEHTSPFARMIREKAQILKQMTNAGSDRPDGFSTAMFGVDAETVAAENGLISNDLFDMQQMPGMRKDFVWAGNVTAKNLGTQFEEELEKQKNKGSDGVNSIKVLDNESIKGKYPLPANNPLGLDSLDFDMPVAYQEYMGRFYDASGSGYKDKIKGFLPFPTDTNLFKGIDPKAFTSIALKKKLGIDDILAGLDPATLDPSNVMSYFSGLIGGEDDEALKNKISKATLSLGPTWTKFFGGASSIPRFTGLGPGKQTFSIGEQIIAQVKTLAKGAGADGDKIDTTSSAFQNSNLEDSLLPTATKSLTKSALEIFQQKQFTRGLSGFLGRNIGIVPRMDIEDSNEAKSVAGFVSNIFGQVGGTANGVFQQAPNARVAQFVKDAYILASGAWQAFGGIRDGDTNLLNDFNTAANAKGEIPKAYAEGLFRSLGGGEALNQIMDLSLPGEYSALMDGKQLKGSMIAKIGPDGGITREPMADAIPDDVSGLIDLIFNPYNEFKGQLRGKLLEQFQNDLRNLKGGRGLPFFDANTQGFIDKGIDTLEHYYAGDEQQQAKAGAKGDDQAQMPRVVNWPGFDHLYDGDPKNISTRGKTLLDTFASSRFDEASAVNAAFGINNKFGPLPGETFIRGRSMKQVEQQNKANGGMIYAQNGQLVNFQPQGTDTVPAMLTPGEFVINRQATQANLPLLKAINSGEHLVPSGFGIGGQVFDEIDEMVNVTNKQALNGQMNSLVENLKKYTSGGMGHEKLIHAAQMGLGVTSTGVGDPGIDGAIASYRGGPRGAKITFQNERMRGATVRHEYAHAFANNTHDGLLSRFINPGVLGEVQNSNYKEAGDTSYTIDQFAKQPSELFAVLSSIKGGIGPKSSQFLRSSFNALGYQNGGLVGSDGMSSLTGYNGKTIKAKLLSVNDRSAVINYQGKRLNVPLNKFDSDTRKALESNQSWSDHMSNTGDLGMSGRPSGPMLPVPKMFTNWHNNGDGNPRSIGSADGSMKKQGRILEVGPNGVVIESLGGSNRGESGFVSFDALDSRTRGVAFELYESAKKHGRGQEIYSDHLRGESQKKLSKRVQKLFPGGVSKKMRSEMDNGHTDSELKSIVERLGREEDITAAGGREAYDRQQRTGTQTRHSENMMNDPTRNRLTPNSRKAGEEPTFGPSQNALDVKVAQSYIRQFKKTGRPISEFNAWADENKPGMAHSRRSLANTLLQQRGDELEQQIGSSSQDVGGSGRRETELSKSRAEQMQSKQDSALSKRTGRMQATYDKIEKRYGPEKAAEMMEKRGFKDGKIIPRVSDSSQEDLQEKMLDAYWKQYNASGTNLDPMAWAKKNKPGLANDEARLKAFVERGGGTFEQAQAQKTDVRTFRTMGPNLDGTGTRTTATNSIGLSGGAAEQRGQEEMMQKIMAEEGVTRWQAGNLLQQKQGNANKNFRSVLDKAKGDFQRGLASTISDLREGGFLASEFEKRINSPQVNAEEELTNLVKKSLTEQGLIHGNTLALPGISLDHLSSSNYRQVVRENHVKTQIQASVRKALMQTKGQPDIDRAGEIGKELEVAGAALMDSFDREIWARYNVRNSRARRLDLTNQMIQNREEKGDLLEQGGSGELNAIDRQKELRESAARRTQEIIEIAKRKEEIIKKQIEHHNKKPLRPRNAEGFALGGVVYANQGMMIPRGTDTVPAMLTPGEFVVNRRSAQANMPLLNSINNGTQYLEKGGAVGSNANFEAFSNVLKTVTDSLNLFNAALIQGSGSEGNAGGEAGGVNTNGIAAFTQNLSSLLSQLEKINIPDSMNVNVGGTVSVNVAGGEAFANLAQQSINSVVHQQLTAALDIVEKETEGQIKNPLK